MADVEDGELGFEEGMSCLPSHVLDEAFSHTHRQQKQDKSNYKQQHQQHLRRSKLPVAEPLPMNSKPGSRLNHRQRFHNNWASRGSGMRAIFLESGQRSCGTGVFLPQRGGTNSHPSRKPACSPVLLPSRVVQALNLNVHSIGLQISPRKDSKANDSKDWDYNNLVKNKNGNDVSAKCSVISQHQSSSPEIFLPKEWTY